LELEFFPYPLLAGLGILIIVLIFLRRKRSLSFLFCFSVFWFYSLLVVSLTIFPIPLIQGTVARSPAAYILSRVNLIPFNYHDLYDGALNVILLEITGNILLTAPFGFGLPFLMRFKPQNVPWQAIGVGLAIETAQLGFCLLIGADYRTVDITDVLLNAIGVLLGYTLFRGFAYWYVAISDRLKVRQKGLLAFVYEIADTATYGQLV